MYKAAQKQLEIMNGDDLTPNETSNIRRVVAHLVVNDPQCWKADVVAQAQTLLDNWPGAASAKIVSLDH